MSHETEPLKAIWSQDRRSRAIMASQERFYQVPRLVADFG